MTIEFLAVIGWLCTFGAAVVVWQLRSALVNRMELVARASHEVRGPLTTVQLGLDRIVHYCPPDSRPRLEVIHQELQRARLALADLSAAQRGGSAVQPLAVVDLASLVREVVAAMQPQAQSQEVLLTVTCTPGSKLVYGERTRLAQAVSNLLANALEHGAGSVAVRVSCSGSHVYAEVADQGPGLPAPISELIRTARRGRSGRGLGLAIAADHAQRHGGQLRTGAGGGACLVLDIPAAMVSCDAGMQVAAAHVVPQHRDHSERIEVAA